MSQRNNSPLKSSVTKKHPPRTAIKKFSNHQPNQVSSGNSVAQTTSSTSDEDRDQLCDICAQNVPGPERKEIFAFGECDHYVCYVCSTRLRVVCDQSDCPICRKKLNNVIFSSTKKRGYEKYNLEDLIFNEKYRIYFESKSILEAFENLLKYECLECLRLNSSHKNNGNNNLRKKLAIKADNEDHGKLISSHESSSNAGGGDGKRRAKSACSSPIAQESTSGESGIGKGDKDGKRTTARGGTELVEKIKEEGQGLLEPARVLSKVFPDVYDLINHLRIVHKLKLCELCLRHNKLFPFEYSYYTEQSLYEHRRKGEPNTSHRGHPSCQLCKMTFFNHDELLQHMSREHFHCHLCGRHDSQNHIYFISYMELRNHFKKNHFLCVRDQCRHEQFTSAFDTELDYQLHLAQAHGNPSVRQQRTITLDSAPHRASRESNQARQDHLPPNAAIVSTGNIATANSSRQLPGSLNNNQHRQQRLPTRAEFPTLGNDNPAFLTPRPTPQTIGPTFSMNNFPSLDSTNTIRPQATTTTATINGTLSSSTPLSQRLVANPSSSRSSFVRTAGGGLRSAEQLDETDFPPLPEQPKAKSKKNKKQSSSSATRNDDVMSLDQLISTSLTLSSNRNSVNGKKSGSKGAGSSLAKKVKQKPLKIQLS